MAILRDLECRNPECKDPTKLTDVMTETGPDGALFVKEDCGVSVEAICDSCHGKLSKVLTAPHIGKWSGVDRDAGSPPPQCMEGCSTREAAGKIVDILRGGGHFEKPVPVVVRNEETGTLHRAATSKAVDGEGKCVADLTVVFGDAPDSCKN